MYTVNLSYTHQTYTSHRNTCKTTTREPRTAPTPYTSELFNVVSPVKGLNHTPRKHTDRLALTTYPWRAVSKTWPTTMRNKQAATTQHQTTHPLLDTAPLLMKKNGIHSQGNHLRSSMPRNIQHTCINSKHHTKNSHSCNKCMTNDWTYYGR